METTPTDFKAERWLVTPGSHAEHVIAYGHHLATLGYSRDIIRRRTACARHFCAWIDQAGIEFASADEDTVRRFAVHDCRCGGNRPARRLSRRYLFRVRHFFRFLAEARVLGVPGCSEPRDNPMVEGYLDWLGRHRGLSPITVHMHRKVLRHLLPVIGSDPSRYDSALIRSAILARQERECPGAVKRTAYVLRSWLRYLGAIGCCPTTLVRAVPTIANWKASYLPRSLPADEVERVIASCDPRRPTGRRDRAIVLLLARLGLRAEDVRSLRVADIDWHRGRVRLRGKTRREISLPLPQEVGDARLAYLEDGRPPSPDLHVFLRGATPWRPFTESAGISKVVARALCRAGEAPSRGAHLLRHSAATSMLRRGATLETIGTVLRHSSLATTAYYAKVDVDMLRLIAQPWPGDRPC